MVAPEGRKQWPDVAIAHLTECDSNCSDNRIFVTIRYCAKLLNCDSFNTQLFFQ